MQQLNPLTFQIGLKTIPVLALISPFIFGSNSALSQDVGFADDFTADSITFTSGSFDDTIGDSSITPTAEGLRLDVSATDSNAGGGLFINAADKSDKFGAEFTHLSEGSLDEVDYTNMFLEAYLYSEVSPETPGYEDRFGTVEAEITYGYGSDGNQSFFYCLQRYNEDGDNEHVDNICGTFPGIAPEFNTKYSMSVELDRASSQVIFSINDLKQSFAIPEVIYPPSYYKRRVQLYINGNDQRDTESSASGLLHSVTLGDSLIDTTNNPPITDHYRTCCDDRPATFEIVDEQLRMATISSTEDKYNGADVRINNPTDYIEATLSMSSESELGNNGNIQGRIETSLYNDQANNGMDGRTGDVYAELRIRLEANGRKNVEYCLRRRTSSDGRNSEDIFDDGRRHCNSFPIAVDFDQKVRASIYLDRENESIVYRANNRQFTWPTTGELFTPNQSYTQINVSGWEGGIPVMYVDSIRTAADAATSTEVAAGTGAEPFPEVDTSIPMADSTLQYPLSETPEKLDFIDDFSMPPSQLSFQYNNDRGIAGIAVVDGAVQLESAKTDPEACCADTSLDVTGPTDYLAAKVSLSSDSALALDGDSSAKVRISGQFYNDTSDGGYDGDFGDVYIQNRLEIRDNGRRQASVCVDRNSADGEESRVRLFGDDHCYTFNTIPMLDTIYELSIRLDREAQTLTIGIDDEMVTTPLNTPAYRPNNPYYRAQVQHQGIGNAIGRVHSITTDSFTQDFSENPPVLPPYRGFRDTQHPGVDAEVADERLNITIDGAATDDERTQFRYVSDSPSDYVSAIINVSSESVSNDGRYGIGVGGHLYNDIQDKGLPDRDNGNTNFEGAVYGRLSARFNNNGENYIEYCAWRSNADDFSSETELNSGETDGDGDCPRIDMSIAFDTDYKLSMALNKENNTIEYTVDDTMVVYQITTGVFEPASYWQGIRADAYGNSKLVGYADDLAFSANPVPLAMSSTLLGNVTSRSGGNAGSDSSGGGCSLGSNSGLQAPMIMLALMGLIRIRRRKH